MKCDIEGTTYDTDEMLRVGPPTSVSGWMGGQTHLLGIYADQLGRLYVLEYSPAIDDSTGEAVGQVLTRCNAKVRRYLVERFGLPAIYLEEVDNEATR